MSKRWGDAVLKIAEENPDIMLDGVHTETPNRKVKGNKYKAQTTVIDGLQFASKAEAKRYQKLRLLESVGATFASIGITWLYRRWWVFFVRELRK